MASERGQTTVEWLGIGAFLVAVLAALALAANPIAGAISSTAQKVICSVVHVDCGNGSSTTPYTEACIVSQGTDSTAANVKIAFVRVSDDSTLIEMRKSDGSASFILMHTGQAQAEAQVKAELELGKIGFDASASAAAGGQLVGAQQWDFTNKKDADAFASKAESSSGLAQLAHDVANGLPPGISNLAGWGLNLVGLHDSSDLPKPTSSYVRVGAIGVLQAGANAGVGSVYAGLDAKLSAAGGAQIFTKAPPNDPHAAYAVYLSLDGNASGNLTAQLFGTPQGVKGGASGLGNAVATVTLDKSGKPLTLTITASAGYTGNLGPDFSLSGDDAKSLSEQLKKVAIKGPNGSGQGIQWKGTLDLSKNPQDVNALLGILDGSNTSGGVDQLVNDFNSKGTQRVQPYALDTSNTTIGAEGDLGIGVGAEGSSTHKGQQFTPGWVKLPNQPWQDVTCKK